MNRSLLFCATLAVAALFGAACSHAAPGSATPAAAPVPEAVVQPGAPGQDSTVESKVPAFTDPKYTPEDVKFMQGMINHHNQALRMVALIPSHSSNLQLHELGDKIQISQGDEIKMMQVWLSARGQTVPQILPDGVVTLNGKVMPTMKGMLSPAQMTALAAARGPAFDKLFLTGMIMHHTGALNMVSALRNAGGGLEPNIADFLVAVDTDQRIEIERMNGLLGRPAL